jgi:hypothetical protein
MTTFNVTNTRQESDQIILFVTFNVNGKLYDETFRFSLSKNLQDILTIFQEKANFYDQREIEMKEAHEKLQAELISEQTLWPY